MRPPGLVAGVCVLLATTAFLSADADGRFDRPLPPDKAAVHVLNRLTFGPRPGDADEVRRLGIERWIREQLHPDRIPQAPALETKLKRLGTLQLASSELFAAHPLPNGRFTVRFSPDSMGRSPTLQMLTTLAKGTEEEKTAFVTGLTPEQRQDLFRSLPLTFIPAGYKREYLEVVRSSPLVTAELIDGKLYRAMYSTRQLEEVLADFWLNHFNVYSGKGPVQVLLTSYERDAIRPHVLGRFRDLLLATARHPAMLFYLDNWQSRGPREGQTADENSKRAPARGSGLNENYGRELMELHTLGVNGGYTQADVIAVARCFTGWTIVEPDRIGEFRFDPTMHDRGGKVVLGRTIPAGGGEEDGVAVIDMLARHPSTAQFISRKLARRFVADDPPQSLVDRMANRFLATDGDLRAVMETLLLSREFLSEGAWQAKMKSPLEVVVSSLRALNAEVTGMSAIAQRIADLGQPLYGKVEPTGYPDTGETWASAAGVLGRMNLAHALAAGQIAGVKADASALVADDSVSREVRRSGIEPSPETLAAVFLASPTFQKK